MFSISKIYIVAYASSSVVWSIEQRTVNLGVPCSILVIAGVDMIDHISLKKEVVIKPSGGRLWHVCLKLELSHSRIWKTSSSYELSDLLPSSISDIMITEDGGMSIFLPTLTSKKKKKIPWLANVAFWFITTFIILC